MKWTVELVVFCTILVKLYVKNANAADSQSLKNVLLIIMDDAGFEFGIYRNKICQTPNIDKFAKESLIFNNAFTSASSCSPSRSAILTGTPSHQNGMYGLHHSIHHFNSFDKSRSITEILNRNGIKTGIIGKKHVGPSNVYPFDFSQTEENNPINQVGRNITHMKLLTREFLAQTNNESKPFFLYIGFHDPHRCGHTDEQYGPFCERWGTGEEGMGRIPDWTPWFYQWDEIQLPYYIQDTEPARRDVSAQYTAISRLDQGIGLILKELESSGHKDDTIVLLTSDNGTPFPSGRTNLYDSGIREPLLISSPLHKKRNFKSTYALTSLLDIVPTILDWYGIKESVDKDINQDIPKLLGKSLLPLLENEPPLDPDSAVYISQTHHEVTMYYPMRAIRTQRYKLIHNLNFRMPFPIDQDFYLSPSFQDILSRTRNKQDLPWYKTLDNYYNRPEWEFYDLKVDPTESFNLAWKPSMKDVMEKLKVRLMEYQNKTNDPWICGPGSVLENMGSYKNNPQCLSLDNGL